MFVNQGLLRALIYKQEKTIRALSRALINKQKTKQKIKQGLVESLVQNGHDGVGQRAGFTEKEVEETTRVYFWFYSNIQVVETFDQDDEEGDEEVEMVRHSVDNADLVIFLSEVEVT